jgi:hypothetical protein
MHLVQLLLPLFRNDGRRVEPELFADVRRELIARFGGMTAYARSPAKGIWEPDAGRVERDDIVVYEVMVDDLDEEWWRAYREALERRFEQQSLVVRAAACMAL